MVWVRCLGAPSANRVFRAVEGADESAIGGLDQDFETGRDGCGGFLAGDGLLAKVVLDQLAQRGRIFGSLDAGGFFEGLGSNFSARAGGEVVFFARTRIPFARFFRKRSCLDNQRFDLATKYEHVVNIEI